MNTVKLNIGGTVFQTTKSTLTKFNGFFKAMFESGIPLNTDESGCIFIDRSAKYFDVVLNYLRDGTVPVPDDNYRKEQILKEAQFYMLDGLIHLCGGEPSDEWKKMHFKIRMIADSEEYKKFRDECKDNTNKKGLVINYNTKVYGDIYKHQAILDFVEKNGDKWDILFYNVNSRKYAITLINGHHSEKIRFDIRAPDNKTEIVEFFELLEKHIIK